MLRTDRLFEIINILRSARSPMSAAQIATHLEVTPRTVYRYIATLQSMRIPIEGAVGIGYVMRKGYNLPPLNFSEEELESIVVGIGLLARTGDASLQSAAQRVLSKIESSRIPSDSLRVSGWGISTPAPSQMETLRSAIRQEQKLQIDYVSLDHKHTRRVILPIVLTYYVEVAVLSAWCTMRQDFRNFRIDRIEACLPLDAFFQGEAKALRARMEREQPELGGASQTGD